MCIYLHCDSNLSPDCYAYVWRSQPSSHYRWPKTRTDSMSRVGMHKLSQIEQINCYRRLNVVCLPCAPVCPSMCVPRNEAISTSWLWQWPLSQWWAFPLCAPLWISLVSVSNYAISVTECQCSVATTVIVSIANKYVSRLKGITIVAKSVVGWTETECRISFEKTNSIWWDKETKRDFD